MRYTALANTAHPAVGFLPMGAILTEEQAGKLGEEMLGDLIARGVIGRLAEPRKAETAEKPAEAPEAARAEETEDPDAETDEPMELEMTEDIVGEAEPEPPKKSGRRKAK